MGLLFIFLNKLNDFGYGVRDGALLSDMQSALSISGNAGRSSKTDVDVE